MNTSPGFQPSRSRCGFLRLAVAVALISATACSFGGAHADRAYRPSRFLPAFDHAAPAVLFDEGHRNVHHLDTTYRPFALLLQADGLTPRPWRQPFSGASLAGVGILVIANAKGPVGHDAESAFTEGEMDAIESWVRGGGALLLIADHTPFGAAARPLAERFGVGMLDGEVFDTQHMDPEGTDRAQLVFDNGSHLLGTHVILSGRGPDERVDRVVTFTGQALVAPPGAARLLVLSPTAEDLPVLSIRMRRTLFDWDRITTFGDPRPTQGNCQALALRYGEGRVVVIGEAAALTAQVNDDDHFGMSASRNQNERFVVNVARWLGGVLEPRSKGVK